MYQTSHVGGLPRPTDPTTENFPRSAASGARTFVDSLQTAISINEVDGIRQLLSKQAADWEQLTPDELADLLLLTVKQGHTNVVQLLSAETSLHKRQAMPVELQLKMAEAALCERKSYEEMCCLLDALLKDASHPEQRVDELAKQAQQDGNGSLADALRSYQSLCSLQLPALFDERKTIHDCAQGGRAAELEASLDRALGIIAPAKETDPPFVKFLTGLGRWFMRLITAETARSLVNSRLGSRPLLHLAAESGNVATVQLLLERGADVHSKHGGTTALALAQQGKWEAVARLLVKHGAVPGNQPPTGFFDEDDDEGELDNQVDVPSKATFEHMLSWLVPSEKEILAETGEMVKALNCGAGMSTAQMDLLQAGFLASLAVSDMDRDRVDMDPDSKAEGMPPGVLQFQSEAVAEGKRREEQRKKEIGRVLDGLTSEFHDFLEPSPGSLVKDLQNAGLCGMLVDLVARAHASAQNNQDWAKLPQRKSILVKEMETRLRQHIRTEASRKQVRARSGNAEVFERLLQRQVALLSLYCVDASASWKTSPSTIFEFS